MGQKPPCPNTHVSGRIPKRLLALQAQEVTKDGTYPECNPGAISGNKLPH